MQITAFCKKEPFTKLKRFTHSHLIRVKKIIEPEFTPALVTAINRAKPFRQVILKMKLTAVVLIIACLQVSASGFAQKITHIQAKRSCRTGFKRNQKAKWLFVFLQSGMDKTGTSG